MNDIIVENLTKTFQSGKVKAIKGITLAVRDGELFGLIGPDGAGKTTLFRILTTLLLADSGSASVCGFDVVRQYREIRKRIGYMPGRFSLYQDLSVEENLNFFAAVFNTSVKENYELIRDIYVQLEPFKKRPAGKLSGGMKQKLALCCALVHRPEVLFLDEPTTGVDTVSRKEFWDMLKKLKAEGITILVSTPYMDEATLCERIALIQHGEIMAVDTPDAIRDQYPAPLFAVKSSEMSRLLKELRQMEDIDSVHSFGEYHHITFKEQLEGPEEATRHALQQTGHQDITISPIKASIEDCFMHFMAKSHQDAE